MSPHLWQTTHLSRGLAHFRGSLAPHSRHARVSRRHDLSRDPSAPLLVPVQLQCGNGIQQQKKGILQHTRREGRSAPEESAVDADACGSSCENELKYGQTACNAAYLAALLNAMRWRVTESAPRRLLHTDA